MAALPGNARIEAQPIQSIMPAVGVHGLSAQFGALRPLLCTNAWELSVANYIVADAVTWRAWHGRRRREKMDGADEGPALYGRTLSVSPKPNEFPVVYG